VRSILTDHDLMLCVGSDVLQMSVWSEVEALPETTKVAMIGLRDWEMGKNFPAEIALRADVKETLKALVPVLKKLGGARSAERPRLAGRARARNWSAQRRRAQGAAPPGGRSRCRRNG
jgi:benzoylformate decarboxylase